jgi:hypothetical protein
MKMALLIGCFAVAACGGGGGSGSAGGSSSSDGVSACVQRGIAYFKEIGSYPTLSSAPNAGRSAESVAQERCQRTTTAF